MNPFDCLDHNKLWKILQEMEIPDHLTCLLRNLYAGQEAVGKTGHGTTNWFQIGKGVRQGCVLSPCLFNFYAEYITWNALLDESQAGIKIARRNINNLRYADDTTLTAESEEELKSLLMRVKEESKKAGLKLSIQKTKIMAPGPITSWQIDGGKVETVRIFIFLDSKITVDGDCNHKILKTLVLWKKSYEKPRQHIKKQRHHFADKGPYSQSYSFSSSQVWMWGLDQKEGWAPKNWCLPTAVLEKTLESPLDSKEIKPVHPKGNQPWLFIGRTDAEAEVPILWSPDAKSWLTEKAPDAGKDWGQEEKGATEDEMIGWHHQLNGHEFAKTWGDSEGQGRLACRSPWGNKELNTT